MTDAAPNHPRGSLRRALKLVKPHRRKLVIGVTCGILAAAFQVGSVTGVLPILQIMIEGEGLHSWVERKIASQRLQADLDLYDSQRDPASTWAPQKPIVVRRISEGSPLVALGVRQTDVLLDAGPSGLQGHDLLRALAEFDDPGRFPLAFATLASDSRTVGEVELAAAPKYWALAHVMASLVPRPDPSEGQLRTMIYVVIAVCVIAVLGSTLRFLSEYFTSLTILRAAMDLRRTLFARVVRLPMSFFSREVSDTVSQFVQDSEEIQRGLQTVFVKLVREPATALFLFGAALVIDWRMTITVAVLAPIVIVIFWTVGRKVRKANKRLLQGWGRMVGALEATLRGIAVVKAYAAENAERVRLWRVDRQMFQQQRRMALLDALIGPSMEVLTLIAACSGLMWLASEVLAHRIEKASFLMLGGLLAMMFDPLRKSANIYNRLQRAKAAAERIYAVIDLPPEQVLPHGAVDIPPLRQAIESQDVTLTYPLSERPALRHVNLTLRRGETVALVGPNGSGKSSLVNCLLRFYDPQEGRILIDGLDIRQATLQSLRRQFSLVTQEPVVFALSLAENIAYGSARPTSEMIAEAARHAYADEFIQLLENGYHTVAGDLGRTLSGGQRQRVAIARAILKNAPILIFDEATSQVDSESEQKIQAALREVAVHRTTLIVAHRLSTIKFATRIILLDRGAVVDIGSHDELYRRSSLYRTLCDTQFVALDQPDVVDSTPRPSRGAASLALPLPLPDTP